MDSEVDDKAALESELAWDIFRSQPMEQFKICIPRSRYREVMTGVIESAVVEFQDPPKASKLFSSEVSMCAECDRKIKVLVNAVNDYLEDIASGDPDGLHAAQVFEPLDAEPPTISDLSELLSTLNQLENDFLSNSYSLREISCELALKREQRIVVEKSVAFIEEASACDVPAPPVFNPDPELGVSTSLLEQGESEFELKHVCAIVLAERTERLRVSLFRSCFSCVLVQVIHLDDPLLYARTGRKEPHDVLMVLFTNEEMRERVTRICRVFDAHVYDFSLSKTADIPAYLEEHSLTDHELQTADMVVQRTIEANAGNAQIVAANVHRWTDFVRREALLYDCLNRCEYSQEYLFILGWVPTVYKSVVTKALQGSSPSSSGLLDKVSDPDTTPPTFIPTTKYTACLQGIVDKYGIARYQELNPGIFCMTFFPFLFGVMFGDILHGVMILMAASVMIAFEKKFGSVDAEVFSMIFGARYAILLMGVCAVYMGFIYNDVAGIPLNLGSSYSKIPGSNGAVAYEYSGSPYLFGVDPVWRHSEQAVQFTNSLKMKMSVIIGVSQMSLGIVLKMKNAVFFKDNLTLYHEALPELLFFLSTVGYMIILIFVKWSTDWESVHQGLRGPPQIINALIGMAMFGTVEEKDVLIGANSCSSDPSGTGACSIQTYLQWFLLAVAVLCVPWMLLVKPLSLPHAGKTPEHEGTLEESTGLLADWDDDVIASDAAPGQSTSDRPEISPKQDTGVGGASSDVDLKSEAIPGGLQRPSGDLVTPGKTEPELREFQELMVEQVIHTIEFVLGAISNTASYLRLWALSLAHAQLSEVFIDYIMVGHQFHCGVSSDPSKYTTVGAVMLLVACTLMWLGCTVGVLLVMESLSAFLHALRLQWVELQGKFYKADGRAFRPSHFGGTAHGDMD